jgi:hypothetical protein
MPHELNLPKKLRAMGWKVKVWDKERLEPPHVTILRMEQVWRLGLRDREFLVPPGGKWKDIHDEVRDAITDSWEELRQAWNQTYPKNPA